jgi:hypothetical protein
MINANAVQAKKLKTAAELKHSITRKKSKMKKFISIQSNQLSVFNPDKNQFILLSEIVICSVEPSYMLKKNDENKAVTEKYHDIQTFRFNATIEDLMLIRDWISGEIEFQKQLQSNFGNNDNGHNK